MPSRLLPSSSSSSSSAPSPFFSPSVTLTVDSPSRAPSAPRALSLSHRSLLISLTIAIVLVFLLALFLYLLYWRRHRKSSAAASNPNPAIPTSLQRLPSSLLRRATSSFSPANKLGHGGFGPVYRGSLPPAAATKSSNHNKDRQRERARPVAIKLMDSTSLQGDREFLNELSLSSRVPPSPFVLLPFAFSLSAPKPHPPFPFPFPFSLPLFRCGGGSSPSPPPDRSCTMLVYDLMPNGSLQDALLARKSPQIVTSWPHRHSVALDVARALSFLHEVCNPPVIHGDVKPSNVLLDSNFRAKLADFGLARERSDSDKEEPDEGEEKDESNLNDGASELATTIGDADFDESNPATSPLAESTSKTNGGDASTKEWWWRQDDSRSTHSKNVDTGATTTTDVPDPGVKKDYVMEWIRSEIKKERPKKEWWAPTSKPHHSSTMGKELDKAGRRLSREWWREEFTEELSKKHKKRTLMKSRSKDWWPRDRESDADSNSSRRKRKNRSWSRPSLDRWGDRTNGSDQVIPRSGATVSSTPSMRGTVCYVAPEYGGGGGPASEKCDMYSFGVLLLVIVSGRRPLQVAPAASPVAEFERASLVSWARHLAHMGRLVELVDPELKDSIGPVEREQVLLCVTVALLCIQRIPTRRPGAGEVVRILCGEAEAPHLPVEFSPSPPGGGFSFKGRRKKAG